MMKTVLFALNAGYSHSALAVRILRDALHGAGLDAEILEATASDRTHAVLSHLVEADAALYSFSCYIWNIDATLALAADLKALLPRAHVVLGGPEVSYNPGHYTALPFVDTVVTGEGEEAIVQIARALDKGEQPPSLVVGKPFAGFLSEGIHYRAGEAPPKLVYYESSRGCPFCCSFCLSSAEEGVRAKPYEQVLRELAEFEAFDEPLTVKLVDRTFNFDRERAKRIWRGLLSPDFTKCYHFEVAAHLLDDESLEILSRFPKGKVRLEIGLQSTNQKTLAAVARQTDAEAVLEMARRLTALGNLHLHLDLIAGLPHEDLASFSHSFDAAYFCCDVLQLGFLKLLHGTALRREADRYGIVFSQKSPYTVLKTAVLSFEELELLHAVSDMTERLRDSGRFPHTLGLLLPRFFTPFAFYRGFCDFLARESDRPLQRIGQRELFGYLSRYAGAGMSPDEREALSEALRADFSMSEVRRAPRDL